jgi:hypothetical protein
MATILHPKDFIQHLYCTCPTHGQLISDKNKIKCQSCNKVYTITENILELVDLSLLDAETARELKGNTIELSEENIRTTANKDSWSDYYNHEQQNSFKTLSRYLNKVNSKQIISLGSGTGYEIKCLSKTHKLKTVYCSDLSYSVLFVSPYTLEQVDINLGLFTSNLDECPIKNKDIPILIFEALHHTSDMHLAIERMLKEGYKHIFFVESTNNFIIRLLSKVGMAQRVEYSGVRPDRLELKKLRPLHNKLISNFSKFFQFFFEFWLNSSLFRHI